MAKNQKMGEIVEYLGMAAKKQEQLLKAMQINPEMYSRILTNAVVKNPAIATCTKDSLMDAVYTSAQWGIVPDGRHGAIVPLKNHKANTVEAEFWPMAWGMLQNARRNIPGLVVHNRIAYKGEHFLERAGSMEPGIEHTIDPEADKSDANCHAFYAVAFLPKNDVPEFEVMYLKEIVAMRKQNKGPWSTHFQAMGMVRPLKRLLKRLPITGSFGELLAADETDGDVGLYHGMGEGVVLDNEGNIISDEEQPKRTRKTQQTQRRAAAKPEPEPEPEPEQVQQADEGEGIDIDIEGEDAGGDPEPEQQQQTAKGQTKDMF